MAVTAPLPTWYKVFGEQSTGSSLDERAATSGVKFVRSQDELGIWNPSATGRYFTAREALRHFGAERLKQVYYDGSALLPPGPTEPARTLRERREALGLTQTEIAKFVGLSVDVIARAESPDYTNNIHDLTRIAMALSLDDAQIGFRPGAGGDHALAVRLKAWRDNVGATPKTIATLSEITWVITVQHRLQTLLAPSSNPLAGFAPSDYYGNAYDPVWDVASDLAQETRRLLGISPDEPIESLRELCRRLEIPLVHAELTQDIAGATLATANVRGIVVNVLGNDANVWVQRATIAHELGHLLWDPAERLKTLVVDERRAIEVIDRNPQDWVEARANAFAVELLAPKDAVRDFTGDLDTNNFDDIAAAVRANMERFGLSATAMRYHLRNTFGQTFDLARVPHPDSTPTDEWRGREAYTDDIFVFHETPIDRRGQFAGVVAKAEQQGWLSDQSAAVYLNVPLAHYAAGRDHVLDLYVV